jgi:CO/xanthine dehydrogenase FAD-binding subunit
MDVLLPRSFAEACERLAEDPARVPIAGGTDLLVGWPQRHEARAKTYLDLWKLAELRPLRWTGDALALGATTTYWDVLCDPDVAREFPLLGHAARQVGAVQIQTRGTWAGNVANASPAADGVAVLMAYDAEVELASCAGSERVALADLYLGYRQMRRRPDQLIRALHLPRRPRRVEIFEKVGGRAAQAIAKLGVAVTRSAAGWRVVASSMAPTVRRCPGLEALLASEAPVPSADALLPTIRADLAPIDDLRASARYRGRVLARVLHAALLEACPWLRPGR